MKEYEYHLISKLATQLEKADWMREAMIRMDMLLDLKTRKTVREACACRLTGRPLKASQAIARENKSLKDRIKAANEAFSVFGGCVRMQGNGKVLVRFAPEGLDRYRCACLRGADKPLPLSYCFCCGGHVRYHLQISLGWEMDYTIRSTALASGGKLPCTFIFRMKE